MKKTDRENRDHLEWIRHQPCAVCGAMGSEPHHWRTPNNAGIALRPPDEITIPLCFTHHREYHDSGKTTWAHKHFPDSVPWGDEADAYVAIYVLMPLMVKRIRELQENNHDIKADLETARLCIKDRGRQ